MKPSELLTISSVIKVPLIKPAGLILRSAIEGFEAIAEEISSVSNSLPTIYVKRKEMVQTTNRIGPVRPDFNRLEQ